MAEKKSEAKAEKEQGNEFTFRYRRMTLGGYAASTKYRDRQIEVTANTQEEARAKLITTIKAQRQMEKEKGADESEELVIVD